MQEKKKNTHKETEATIMTLSSQIRKIRIFHPRNYFLFSPFNILCLFVWKSILVFLVKWTVVYISKHGTSCKIIIGRYSGKITESIRMVTELFHLWYSQKSEQLTFGNLAGFFFFFPMISFCIYYNWKWSHFYLDTLFLVCTFKFHRTVLQHLYPLKTTITRAIWKVILQARTDKNSLFCRLWKSQIIIVILVGEGVCDNKRQIIPTDFNYAVKTWGWFVAFFIKMWKLISTNFYCFAVVTYIYTFTDSVLFGLFLFGPKSN